MIFDPIGHWPNDKPQTLKADFPIILFNGQVGITFLRIIRFQNFNHHYKWENVYFRNIPITELTMCTEESHFDRMYGQHHRGEKFCSFQKILHFEQYHISKHVFYAHALCQNYIVGFIEIST